jgi:hypothetical protein
MAIFGPSGGGSSSGAGTVLGAGDAAGDTISIESTRYATFIDLALAASDTFSATESARQMIIPRAGTLKNLYVKTLATQASDAGLVLTVRVNGVDTGITITVAASAAAGVFSDTTHTAVVAAGDLLSLAATNLSGDTAATVGQWVIVLE